MLDFTQPSSAGGKGASYSYTKSPVVSALAAPKWNTGDFVVRHYTVPTTGSDRHARREQQQQNPGDSPCFERYSDARNTVQLRLGRTPPPSMVSGMEAIPYSGVNIQTTEVLSRRGLQRDIEARSIELLKRVPESY